MKSRMMSAQHGRYPVSWSKLVKGSSIWECSIVSNSCADDYECCSRLGACRAVSTRLLQRLRAHVRHSGALHRHLLRRSRTIAIALRPPIANQSRKLTLSSVLAKLLPDCLIFRLARFRFRRFLQAALYSCIRLPLQQFTKFINSDLMLLIRRVRLSRISATCASIVASIRLLCCSIPIRRAHLVDVYTNSVVSHSVRWSLIQVFNSVFLSQICDKQHFELPESNFFRDFGLLTVNHRRTRDCRNALIRFPNKEIIVRKSESTETIEYNYWIYIYFMCL